MSRSRKKINISGITTSESEKREKRLANRKLRVAVRIAMSGDAEIMPDMREVSNVWSFGKDGKRWWGGKFIEGMRK